MSSARFTISGGADNVDNWLTNFVAEETSHCYFFLIWELQIATFDGKDLMVIDCMTASCEDWLCYSQVQPCLFQFSDDRKVFII